MRKFISLILLFTCFLCNNSYSQDLIVTEVGDSIACKILFQTKDYVHFSYTRYNHNTVRELRTGSIKSVITGFYLERDSRKAKSDSVKVGQLLKVEQVPSVDTSINIIAGDMAAPTFSKWQFGINGGYAYRLFKPKIKSTPYELKYLDELKSGYSVGAELFYFHWKKVGFGLKYDIYKSKGQRDIRTSDDITIQFIGSSVAHRMTFQNNKTSILTAFWLGYQPYHNVARFIGQNYTVNASTMGWGVSVGLDQKLSKKLAINFSVACFMGSAYKFKKELKGRTEVINLSSDSFEDLSRAEFTFGLKFLK